MAKDKLTKRQQEILDFILSEINRKGYPPSVREIGKAVGLSSSSTVHNHLAQLEKKGFIRRDPTKPRALEVFDFRKTEGAVSESKVRNVPVVGRIAAGEPILAEQNIEDVLPLPATLVAAEEVFALKVHGDSMIGAGILDDDYIVVQKQPTAENGEIVVALTEDEATVKRFYKEADHVRLQPENPAMKPIFTDNVSVVGKAVAVFRRL